MQKTQQFSCIKHTKNIAKYILVDPDDSQLFKCSECLIESVYDNNQLILLKQIIDNKQEQYITNWPPQVNKEILKKCKNIIGQQQKEQIIQDINTHYDNFEKEVIKILQTSRKRTILTLIDSLSQLEEETKKEYYQMSKVDQLKNIISDQDTIISNLKDFFNEMISQSQQNEEILKKQHEKFQQTVNSLQLSYLAAIKQTTILFVESINRQHEKNQMKENQEKDNYEQTKKDSFEETDNDSNEEIDQQIFENSPNIQNIEFNFQSIANITLNLINHVIQVQNDHEAKNEELKQNIEKTNKQLKFHNNNLQNIFTKDLINPYLIQQTYQQYKDNNENIKTQFSLIKQQNKKISQIEKVIQKLLSFDIQYIDQVYQLFEIFQNYDSKNSNSDYVYQRLCQDLELKKLIKEDILQQFPIFDIGVKNKIIPLKFALFELKNNKQKPIIILKNNFTQLIDTKYNNSILKFNQILDNKKKYIIRFRFNKPYQKLKIKIGLLNDRNDCRYNCMDDSYLSVRKGQKLSDVNTEQNNIMQVEMRVQIQEKTVIYTDYPQYENVNQNVESLDKDDQWRISLQSKEEEQVIEITEFLEVEDFSKLY